MVTSEPPVFRVASISTCALCEDGRHVTIGMRSIDRGDITVMVPLGLADPLALCVQACSQRVRRIGGMGAYEYRATAAGLSISRNRRNRQEVTFRCSGQEGPPMVVRIPKRLVPELRADCQRIEQALADCKRIEQALAASTASDKE